MLSFDPRALEVPAPSEGAGEPEPPFAIAVSRGGLGFRFSLRAHRDPSTRAGRKFAKLNEGDDVVSVLVARDRDAVLCATSDGHALGVTAGDISVLAGVGKGAMVMKVSEGERIVGAVLATTKHDAITVETEKNKTLKLERQKIAGTRGDKGEHVSKRDRFARVILAPVVAPVLGDADPTSNDRDR